MKVSLGSCVDKRGALLIYSFSLVNDFSHSGAWQSVALEMKNGAQPSVT